MEMNNVIEHKGEIYISKNVEHIIHNIKYFQYKSYKHIRKKERKH